MGTGSMSIIEKVTQAILNKASTNGIELDGVPDYGYPEKNAELLATAAITAFLEAAAEKGWHMRPDFATAKMRVAATESVPKDGSRAQGRYDAMLAAAPEFKWDGK